VISIRSVVKSLIYHSKFASEDRRTQPSNVSEYRIRAGYRHRHKNTFYDDTVTADEWQKEVYECAADEAARLGATSIFDIGCGSGRKLVKYFPNLRTVGFDLPPTIEFLKKEYPNRDWRPSEFSTVVRESCDIAICSDVIEHIPNPDSIMGFLALLKCTKLILSTPERNLLYGFDQSGPPRNKAHCREWTMSEFGSYVRQWFDVELHTISNRSQATQLMVCTPR